MHRKLLEYFASLGGCEPDADIRASEAQAAR
jgi:hypothetical protein